MDSLGLACGSGFVEVVGVQRAESVVNVNDPPQILQIGSVTLLSEDSTLVVSVPEIIGSIGILAFL